jgi:hypothetical protein
MHDTPKRKEPTMENITITIETGNAAFDDSPTAEIARILRDLAKRFELDGLPPSKILDANGNCVGRCEVEKA